jgi:hypothetical protein
MEIARDGVMTKFYNGVMTVMTKTHPYLCYRVLQIHGSFLQKGGLFKLYRFSHPAPDCII